jgi:hypothetical protein
MTEKLLTDIADLPLAESCRGNRFAAKIALMAPSVPTSAHKL